MKAEEFRNVRWDGTLEQLQAAYAAFMDPAFWEEQYRADQNYSRVLKDPWFGFDAETDMHAIRLQFVEQLEEYKSKTSDEYVTCTRCGKRIYRGMKAYIHEYGSPYCGPKCLITTGFYGHYQMKEIGDIELENN